MANTSKKKKTEPVTNCDQIENETDITPVEEIDITKLIVVVRGKQVLIDNFVDDRVLSLLDKRADHVEATIYSRYYESFQTDLKKHNEQYRELR